MCYCNTKRMCVMSLNRRSNRRAVRRRSRPRPPTLLTLKERRYLTFQHHHNVLNLGCQFLSGFHFYPSLPLSPFPSPLLKTFCEPFSSPSNFFNRTPHQLKIILFLSFNCSSHLISLDFIALPNLTRSYSNNSSTLTTGIYTNHSPLDYYGTMLLYILYLSFLTGKKQPTCTHNST